MLKLICLRKQRKISDCRNHPLEIVVFLILQKILRIFRNKEFTENIKNFQKI